MIIGYSIPRPAHRMGWRSGRGRRRPGARAAARGSCARARSCAWWPTSGWRPGRQRPSRSRCSCCAGMSPFERKLVCHKSRSACYARLCLLVEQHVTSGCGVRIWPHVAIYGQTVVFIVVGNVNRAFVLCALRILGDGSAAVRARACDLVHNLSVHGELLFQPPPSQPAPPATVRSPLGHTCPCHTP